MIFKVKLVKRLTLAFDMVAELVEIQGCPGEKYVNERNARNDCTCRWLDVVSHL